MKSFIMGVDDKALLHSASELTKRIKSRLRELISKKTGKECRLDSIFDKYIDVFYLGALDEGLQSSVRIKTITTPEIDYIFERINAAILNTNSPNSVQTIDNISKILLELSDKITPAVKVGIAQINSTKPLNIILIPLQLMIILEKIGLNDIMCNVRELKSYLEKKGKVFAAFGKEENSNGTALYNLCKQKGIAYLYRNKLGYVYGETLYRIIMPDIEGDLEKLADIIIQDLVFAEAQYPGDEER